MKKNLSYIFALCILPSAFVSTILANIPTDWYFGRVRDFTSARSLGLAGISTIIPSPAGMLINPALIGLIKQPSFELAADLNWTSEKRTKELYDQFENTIGEISVADNMFTNSKIGPIAITYPMSAFGGARVCFGLGYAPVIDYNYYFTKELRDDFYQLIGDYEIKATGQTQSINFATGVNLNKLLSVGAGFFYSWGNHLLTQDTRPDVDSFNVKTLNFNFGIIPSLGERFKLGFDFQNRWKMHWNYSPLQVYPPIIVYYWTNSIGFGASYNFPGDIPTVALTELRYIYWQNSDYPDYWSNILNIRVGIEHIMFNGVALRYGFGVIPSSIKLIQPNVLVSLGLGFDIQSVRVDIGGNLQRRTLTSENFYYPIAEERVYQTFGDVVLSISKSF
jgi:hypothetical protein